MMKLFYAFGIILSIFFFIMILGLDHEVRLIMGSYILEEPDILSYDLSEVMNRASMRSLYFFLFFIGVSILGLVKVKTKVMKLVSISVILISTILLVWDCIILVSGDLSFAEVSLVLKIYSLLMLCFMIVGLIQSFKHSKKRVRLDTSGIIDNLDS